MALQDDTTALASFEAKWAATHPELGLALKFVPAHQRRSQAAFACLALELEYAAFGIRETEPAAIKLQWWADEFARAGAGEPRHPLTQALAGQAAFARIPLAHWHSVVAGALAQRDPQPASDHAASRLVYLPFYRPLAMIEAELFGPLDVSAQTRQRTLARALRETAALAGGQRDDRLPLPLDLLARHRLVRGDLSRVSPRRDAAVREWLSALQRECGNLTAAADADGILGHTALYADRWRIRRAARAGDPLGRLNGDLARLPLGAAWAAWRAARRSSP